MRVPCLPPRIACLKDLTTDECAQGSVPYAAPARPTSMSALATETTAASRAQPKRPKMARRRVLAPLPSRSNRRPPLNHHPQRSLRPRLAIHRDRKAKTVRLCPAHIWTCCLWQDCTDVHSKRDVDAQHSQPHALLSLLRPDCHHAGVQANGCQSAWKIAWHWPHHVRSYVWPISILAPGALSDEA